MQRQIKFIKPASSTVHGSFGVGDLGRFDAEVASHFVNDAACAEYTDTPAAAVQAPAPTPARKAGKAGKSGKAGTGEAA